jgi:hypothetical protein
MSVASRTHRTLTSPLLQEVSKSLVVPQQLNQADFTEGVPTLFEYTLPTNDMSPSLPRGSVVSLLLVGLEDVSVGDVLLRVYCSLASRRVLEIGRLHAPRHAANYRASMITLKRDIDGVILFDDVPWMLPHVYWFRVEQVLSIARPALYWPPVTAAATA